MTGSSTASRASACGWSRRATGSCCATRTATPRPGAFRRYRADAPRIGHTFSTIVDGVPASWQVADDRLQRDEQGKPYRELTAERDYSEAEDAPDLPEHELEHALAREDDRDEAVAALARAEEAGQLVELVALEPGEAPDWDEGDRYIDALILDEIEDDLLRAVRRRHQQ